MVSDRDQRTFGIYATHIANLPDCDTFSRSDLLISTFRLESEGRADVYYAPFDYINPAAKVAIVGITPGWTQMELAFQVARRGLQIGMPSSDILKKVKSAASFAGSMRHNLILMLDGIGLSRALGIESCATLFNKYENLLHSTSALRYPVFVHGENYTGHVPHLLGSRMFTRIMHQYLAEELTQVSDAIIVPLGASVSRALESLVNAGLLDARRCLFGFPHPSGGNGHRAAQFRERRDDLSKRIESWF